MSDSGSTYKHRQNISSANSQIICRQVIPQITLKHLVFSHGIQFCENFINHSRFTNHLCDTHTYWWSTHKLVIHNVICSCGYVCSCFSIMHLYVNRVTTACIFILCSFIFKYGEYSHFPRTPSYFPEHCQVISVPEHRTIPLAKLFPQTPNMWLCIQDPISYCTGFGYGCIQTW